MYKWAPALCLVILCGCSSWDDSRDNGVFVGTIHHTKYVTEKGVHFTIVTTDQGVFEVAGTVNTGRSNAKVYIRGKQPYIVGVEQHSGNIWYWQITRFIQKPKSLQ